MRSAHHLEDLDWSVTSCLARIDEDDGAIGAVIALDRANALKAAEKSTERWQRNEPLSPADGMPILIKANIAVEGLPWSAGIGAYRTRLASRDASCVARLRAAGAIILGITNMDEGGLGGVTDNMWFGRTDNPAFRGFSAGGSSGGSAAAVAANFCLAALGTDTIGSVRIPAGYCGVVGYTPAFDAIPVQGVIPLAASLDRVGVIAKSAGVCRIVGALASAQSRPLPAKLVGLCLAILDDREWPNLSDDLRAQFRLLTDTARARGIATKFLKFTPERFSRLQKLLFMLAEIEGADVHWEGLQHFPDGFSPAFRKMLEWGARAGPQRTEAIRTEISELVAEFRLSLLGTVGILLPTTTAPAFQAEQRAPSDQSIFVAVASALKWPATSFPVSADCALPLSAQIVARDDGFCLDLAEWLMQGIQG